MWWLRLGARHESIASKVEITDALRPKRGAAFRSVATMMWRSGMELSADNSSPVRNPEGAVACLNAMFFSRQPDVKGTNIPENQKKGRKSSATESVVVDWRGEAAKSESAKNRSGSPRETLGGSFFLGCLCAPFLVYLLG